MPDVFEASISFSNKVLVHNRSSQTHILRKGSQVYSIFLISPLWSFFLEEDIFGIFISYARNFMPSFLIATVSFFIMNVLHYQGYKDEPFPCIYSLDTNG